MMFAGFLFLSICGLGAAQSLAPAGELTGFSVEKPRLSSHAPFLAGANYPWFNYGTDFGSEHGVSDPAVSAAVSADFDFLASKGVKAVRWFIFCEGRHGLAFGEDGMVTGLSPTFSADFEAALAIARVHRIQLVPVLFNFGLLKEPDPQDATAPPDRTALVKDARAMDSLFVNALEPVFRKYGADPAILAWEVMNEPEMGLKKFLRSSRPVSFRHVYAFAQRVVEAVHAAGGLATLGSYRRGNVAKWRGLGLDFYQYHYYDYMGWLYGEQLDAPVADLQLDKPCILGEFQTKSKHGVDTYLEASRSAGLAGAFAWSLRATDPKSDFRSAADRFAAWAAAH